MNFYRMINYSISLLQKFFQCLPYPNVLRFTRDVIKSLKLNQVDDCDRGVDRMRSIDGQRQLSISAIDKAVELTNDSRRSAAEILKVLI
jgi:hypothetical protein